MLGNILKGGTGRKASRSGRDWAPPVPQCHIYVIGDIHGRSDLLERLLHRIDTELETIRPPSPSLVFLGDYIDRGEQSADVLLRIRQLNMDLPHNVICLMGNHERMMLDFLDRPTEHGARWLRNGGLQTLSNLQSIPLGVGESVSPDALMEMAGHLRHNLPEGMEDWLRNLPLSWNSGNVWAVHAGADPTLPMNRQEARTLLWGHPGFRSMLRDDGQWVVHGHTVVEAPQAADGRISIDTGAYYSGQLTAAVLRPTGEVGFMTS